MRRKIIMGVLAALGALGALTPVASAQDITWQFDPDPARLCREVSVGSTFQTLCVEVGQNLNTRYGASAAPYAQVSCDGILHCGLNPVSVGRTGFHYNPFYPLPTVIVGSATVYHPGGEVGTLYADGQTLTVTTPSWCVGDPDDCPGGGIIIGV